MKTRNYRGRASTRDMLTYDAAAGFDSCGNALGRNLGGSFRTVDGRTVDSTGAFLVGELERLDQTLHEPLAAVTWSRDIDLREDVSIADEVSSFTLTNFSAAGGLGTGAGIGNGKAWIGKTTDQIAGVGLDIGKVPHPLRPWGVELKYTVLELESAAKLGRPIDQQKYQAMQLKHQMDVDEQVYIGDTSMGDTGLVNNSLMTNVSNAAAHQTVTTWAAKLALADGSGPDAVLADVNELLTSVWAASAWAVMPNRLLLPPAQFGLISTVKVSSAGNVSVLKYLMENNISVTSGKGGLEIYPCKWLNGAGVGGTIGTSGAGFERMLAYTKDQQRVRFPMTMLNKTPVQYDSIYQKLTYFCRLGVVELVYPETMGARDGI